MFISAISLLELLVLLEVFFLIGEGTLFTALYPCMPLNSNKVIADIILYVLVLSLYFLNSSLYSFSCSFYNFSLLKL